MAERAPNPQMGQEQATVVQKTATQKLVTRRGPAVQPQRGDDPGNDPQMNAAAVRVFTDWAAI